MRRAALVLSSLVALAGATALVQCSATGPVAPDDTPRSERAPWNGASIDPDTEECAVVGAALDSLFIGDGSVRLFLSDSAVVESTWLGAPDTGAYIPLDRAFAQTGKVPAWLRDTLQLAPGVARSFAARNASRTVCATPPARVPVIRIARREFNRLRDSVYQDADGAAGDGMGLLYPGLVDVSRVGFSDDRRQAMLTLGHWCGPLCAGGWIVVLERGDEGRWRVARSLMLWVS